MTPTDALAAALVDASIYDLWDEDDGTYSDKDYAERILAALTEGTHLFTEDSLAAALDAHDSAMTYGKTSTHLCDGFCAAAIIQAAKEGQRE